MKIPEQIQRRPYLYAGSAAFLLAVGGIETAAYVDNPTYDRPDGACVSPWSISPTHVDKDTSTFWQTYTGVNTTGVVATGKLPKSAYGVEISYATPGADNAEVNGNASDMLKADASGRYAAKLAIGSGEVQFAARIIAPEGSALCDSAPDTSFIHKNASEYDDAAGTLPWPNPVNAVVNLF